MAGAGSDLVDLGPAVFDVEDEGLICPHRRLGEGSFLDVWLEDLLSEASCMNEPGLCADADVSYSLQF